MTAKIPARIGRRTRFFIILLNHAELKTSNKKQRPGVSPGPDGWDGDRPRALDASAADDADHDEHDRDHEQDVDEVAERVAADEPEQPQDDENHRDRKQHG